MWVVEEVCSEIPQTCALPPLPFDRALQDGTGGWPGSARPGQRFVRVFGVSRAENATN